LLWWLNSDCYGGVECNMAKRQQRILQLLSRSVPLLLTTVSSSKIKGAGLGVFARQTIEPEQAICLYPGVYSAGLPAVTTCDESVVYLGHLKTPSGVPTDENAYILCLQSVGGYLDGMALIQDGIKLDENPNACAHLVNHSSVNDNVEIESIVWHEILPNEPLFQSDYYHLPNLVRSDQARRGFLHNETIYYNGDEPNCGAVLLAKRRIQQGEELLLNYKLNLQHNPKWASDWYE
jgi:hypothetical protein